MEFFRCTDRVKKYIRRGWFWSLAFAWAVLLCPILSRAEELPKYELVFVCPNYEHQEYWGKVISGMASADAELNTSTKVVGGVSYDHYKNDVLKAVREIADADELPDGLMLFGGVEETLLVDAQGRVSGDPGFDQDTAMSLPGMMAKIKERGCPMICIGADVSDSGKDHRAARIGADMAMTGRTVASYLYKQIGRGGKVGVITTDAGTGNDKLWLDTFSEYCEAQGMQLVSVQSTSGNRETAVQMTAQLLEQYSDLDAVYVAGTVNVEGAGAYVSEHKGEYPDLTVIAQGESDEVLEYIREGIIQGTYMQQTEKIGYLGVYYMFNLLEDGYLPVQYYSTGMSLVTAKNADTYNEPQKTKTVIVGYYNDASRKLQLGGEDGRKSGYAYDYLQKISTVANWIYEYEYYASKADALEALSLGEVDIVAGISPRESGYDSQTMLLTSRDMGVSEELYFAVNINRIDIYNDLNNAMASISSSLPGFTLSLFQEYYREVVGQGLTAEERQWLNEREKITIGYIRDNLPISSEGKSGQPVGLVADLTDFFCNRETGFLARNGIRHITVSTVAYPSAQALEQALASGEVDVAFPVCRDYWFAESNGFKITDEIFSDRLMMLFQSGSEVDNATLLGHVAIRPQAIGMAEIVKAGYPGVDIHTTVYETAEEAVAAVERGDATCFIGAAFVVQRYRDTMDDRGKNLNATFGQTESFSMAMRQEDVVLIAVMNNFIRQIDEGDITFSLAKHGTVAPQYSLREFVKNNFVYVVAALTVIAALITVIFILYVLREKRFNAERAQSHAALAEAYERAEHANKAKSVFLSNMSHDIRTPMNGIVGMTLLAEKYIDDKERVKDSLAKIKSSSNHLLDIINNILDISKIESGKLVLDQVNFPVRDIITEMLNIVRPAVSEKNQHLNVRIEGVDREWIYGDPVRISQIFINLLSNAVKYTPDGGTINVSLTQELIPGGKKAQLTYIVEDNGMGMTKEYMSTMFETFSRAQDSRTNKIQGTGLGLAIVHQLITLMNGTIECESELNKGTKFTIRLEFPVGATKEKEPVKENDYSDLAGLRILIAEDNDLNWEVIRDLLDMYEIETERAENGKVCLEKMRNAEEGDFCMILMDVNMPDMDGKTATREIRKLDNSYARSIPIIAMTADAFKEDIDSCLEAGMDEHLSKPIDMPKLLGTVRKYVTKIQ